MKLDKRLSGVVPEINLSIRKQCRARGPGALASTAELRVLTHFKDAEGHRDAADTVLSQPRPKAGATREISHVFGLKQEERRGDDLLFLRKTNPREKYNEMRSDSVFSFLETPRGFLEKVFLEKARWILRASGSFVSTIRSFSSCFTTLFACCTLPWKAINARTATVHINIEWSLSLLGASYQIRYTLTSRPGVRSVQYPGSRFRMTRTTISSFSRSTQAAFTQYRMNYSFSMINRKEFTSNFEFPSHIPTENNIDRYITLRLTWKHQLAWRWTNSWQGWKLRSVGTYDKAINKPAKGTNQRGDVLVQDIVWELARDSSTSISVTTSARPWLECQSRVVEVFGYRRDKISSSIRTWDFRDPDRPANIVSWILHLKMIKSSDVLFNWERLSALLCSALDFFFVFGVTRCGG